MNLLAIDTSTDACSAALLRDDGSIIDRFELAPRRQAELILPMVEAILAESGLALRELDGLAFGRGPGAFTGLRIAAGVVQGIAYGAGLKAAPVSSLAALAQQAFAVSRQPQVLAALDARMGQVYWGAYRVNEHGLMQLMGAECVADPALVALPDSGEWLGVGSGFEAYAEPILSRTTGATIDRLVGLHPRAREIALLGQQVFLAGGEVEAALALPVYLRDRVAEKPSRSAAPN